MTVFQYFDSLDDGGVPTLVKNNCLILKKYGIKPVVVINAPIQKTAVYRQLCEEDIPIFSIFNHSDIPHRLIYKIFGPYIYKQKLKRLLSKIRPEVIHVHMWNLERIASIGDILGDVKLFYTCHSVPERYLGQQTCLGEYNSAKKLILRNKLQMISLHEDMRKAINKMFNIDNTITLNNGIDFSKYQPLTQDETSRLQEEIGLSSKDFVMGHVGRFDEVKNHGFILRVFSELLKVKPNSKLLLIGNGPLEEEIRRKADELRICERIIILQHRTDVNKLLRLMNVFIFPSLFEGLSLALLEAQISGLKCIVSDSINPAGILTEKTIPLSLSLSPKQWCDAIFDDTLRNPHPGDINQFDLRTTVKKLKNLYES